MTQYLRINVEHYLPNKAGQISTLLGDVFLAGSQLARDVDVEAAAEARESDAFAFWLAHHFLHAHWT